MTEESSVFRKKSIDRVNSPEELNDYIKVANPTVWISLAAIVVFLVGVCVWGFVGHLETRVNAVAVSTESATVVYVSDEYDSVRPGMTVRAEGFEGQIIRVPATPVSVADSIDSYAQHIGDFSVSDYVFEVETDLDIPDGTYSAEIVVDSVSPMSLILN